MKRIVIAVGLMVLLFAVSAAAQVPAPKPGPEHKKLEIWVGDWTIEAEAKATPVAPARKSSTKVSVRPILGGFFLEFRGETKGTTTTQYVEIDGYDPVTKKYTWNGFGSDGGFVTATYTIEGNTVSISATRVTAAGNQIKMRSTIVFAPDFMSYVETRERSIDGKEWMPVVEAKATKVKSSPK